MLERSVESEGQNKYLDKDDICGGRRAGWAAVMKIKTISIFQDGETGQ